MYKEEILEFTLKMLIGIIVSLILVLKTILEFTGTNITKGIALAIRKISYTIALLTIIGILIKINS